MKTNYPHTFHFTKVYPSMTPGFSRDTIFQATRLGASFETGDFVKEMLGRLP